MKNPSLLTFILLAFSFSAFAQTAPIRGKVELKKADGSVAPVAGALIELYAVDIPAKFPSAKTGTNGVFIYAGIPIARAFVIAVSGTGIAPAVFPKVRSGMEDILITVTPGDGKILTREEVMQAIAPKPAVADVEISSVSQVKDVKHSDPFYSDLQSLVERYGITGLTYGGEFRASEKLLVSSYEDITEKGLTTLKRMALVRKLEPAEIFGLVCSLQSPAYVIDTDAIQHLNCLYGIKLTDTPGKVKELTRGEFATLFNEALGQATARISALKPRPKNALGMWRITLTFKEGTQTYFLSLEKNGAVSGGKMFQIQGSSFDIKNFRQVGKTVSFTAMFGKVPVAFRGTIDDALMNMKGSFTGTEKGKRMTAAWAAVRDTEAEKK